MAVTLLFAVVNGDEFSSYYIFYGTLFFAVAYVSALPLLYEAVTGWLLRAAGYQRRAVLVGTGSTSRRSRTRSTDAGHSPSTSSASSR